MKQKNHSILEEEEFLQVIEKYKTIITKICYFYSNDSEEFQDLRQDVLAAIWYARSSFKGHANLSTWIYRIALNTCISALRKHKRSGKKVSLDALGDIAVVESDKIARYKEMYELINNLKGDDKAIILLWLDELPYEEIANIIGLQRNTLATRLRRIKQRLIELANK